MIELKAFRFGYNFPVSLDFQSLLLLAATAVVKITYNELAFNEVTIMQQFSFLG